MEINPCMVVCPLQETANKKKRAKQLGKKRREVSEGASDFEISRTYEGVGGNYGVDTARGVSAQDRFLFANRCKCFKQLQDARQIFARGLQGFSSLYKEIQTADSKGKKKLDAGLQKRLEVSAVFGTGREGTRLER